MVLGDIQLTQVSSREGNYFSKLGQGLDRELVSLQNKIREFDRAVGMVFISELDAFDQNVNELVESLVGQVLARDVQLQGRISGCSLGRGSRGDSLLLSRL